MEIRLRDVGAKRRLNGTLKVNRHTDTQTHGRTDISTYRKHRPRGPMLWKWLIMCKLWWFCSLWPIFSQDFGVWWHPMCILECSCPFLDWGLADWSPGLVRTFNGRRLWSLFHLDGNMVVLFIDKYKLTKKLKKKKKKKSFKQSLN